MLSLIKRGIKSDSAWSMYAQVAMLIANFGVFILLIKQHEAAAFGHWALYITIISIADSFRQGVLQNGLIRLLIQEPSKAPKLTASALFINYGFIAVVSSSLLVVSFWVNDSPLGVLLSHGFKSLIALGTLQFINMLVISRKGFKQYFMQNLLYMLSMATGLILLSYQGQITFTQVINMQLLSALPSVLYYVIMHPIRFVLPEMKSIKALLSFGKYVAGTNLLSMLFHKADVLMLAFFTGPTAVALFHFASKIVGYTDLPLNALSQVIYPELAASHRRKDTNDLKRAYIDSIVRLLLLAIPLVVAMMLLNKEIINILSTEGYANASQVIIVLCLGALCKPAGRVFGLLLDAMGKPKVNFQMLAFSLTVNIGMNLLLIPAFGVLGAAIATSTSILLTVTVGQWKLRKWLIVNYSDLKGYYLQSRFSNFFTKTSLT